jgi:hypothetical protein
MKQRINITIPADVQKRAEALRKRGFWPHGSTSKACVLGLENMLGKLEAVASAFEDMETGK